MIYTSLTRALMAFFAVHGQHRLRYQSLYRDMSLRRPDARKQWKSKPMANIARQKNGELKSYIARKIFFKGLYISGSKGVQMEVDEVT